MAIDFDPEVFETVRLNHYILFEGAVPQKMIDAIALWLKQFRLIQMTETLWCYRVPASGKVARERQKSFRETLYGARESGGEPYRIIWLSPFGQGEFSHGMPGMNFPGSGKIGIGYKQTNPADEDK